MVADGNIEILNCYDSHVHFVATGQTSQGLKLNNINSIDKLQELKIVPEFFQGDWLVGFGWNQHDWHEGGLPSSAILDKCFPDIPVYFSRVDGHAGWLNTKAKSILGLSLNKDIVVEKEHIDILLKLPSFSREQKKSHIKQSIKLFNQGGFTYVRDMSMNLETMQLLEEINNNKEQTVCIEAFVTCEGIHDFERVFIEYQKCRNVLNPLVKMKGIKIFSDGSLGSQTARLSNSYLSDIGNKGLMNWTDEELFKIIELVWKNKMEIAVHTIGDEAVRKVVHAARKVSASGILGKINLEHVQLLDDEIIKLMKPLHVTCHMQPCHWLSDKQWVHNILNKEQIKMLFQWEKLRKNKIPFYFGSDSPIEPSNILNSIRALEDSALHGISKLQDSWINYHTYPDQNWIKSKTLINDKGILQVWFDEQLVYETNCL